MKYNTEELNRWGYPEKIYIQTQASESFHANIYAHTGVEYSRHDTTDQELELLRQQNKELQEELVHVRLDNTTLYTNAQDFTRTIAKLRKELWSYKQPIEPCT